MRFLLLITLLLTPHTATAAEPLRWKFAAEQELPYRIVKTQQMEVDGGAAGTTKSELTQTIDMAWKVESVGDDGAARMTHDVTRVQVRMQGPYGTGYEFDTASEEPPADLAALVAPALKAMEENDYTVTITPRGEMTDLDAPADLIDALRRAPGGEGANDYSVGMIARPIAIPLPEEAMNEGTEWSQTSESVVPMFGRQEVVTTYRCAGPKLTGGRSLAVLTPTVTLTTAVGESAETITGTLKPKKSDGEILFDRGAGRLESSRVEQTLDAEIKTDQAMVTGVLKQSIIVTYGENDSEGSTNP